MPQESNLSSIFSSPSKNLRGLKSLIYNSTDHAPNYAEDFIDDRGFAQRKAEEAATRRYQAAQWLRQMDKGASAVLPEEPMENQFCLALRNGLILCNVLNKINPGAVHKVVENPVLDVQAVEGAAQSAIQYFENMRNFLVAVGKMKLLTFEASDLEKGGSSGNVVECILCLKGYYEWKKSGGIGVWKYGGTVRITSLVKESPSSVVSCESADESLDDSETSQYEQLLEFLHLSSESHEESRAANVVTFIFDHFSLSLLQTYVAETSGFDELPLNPMVVDMMLRKVVKDFSALLVSQGNQLRIYLKKVLNDSNLRTRSQFLEAISKYLSRRASFASKDISFFCTCGGKREGTWSNISSNGRLELLDLQQKKLEDLKSLFGETKQEFYNAQLGMEKEFKWLDVKRILVVSFIIFNYSHIKGLEVAASSYHEILEENRVLYNQVQDLKGTIRVFCRVKPFPSGQSNGQSTVDYIGENGNLMIVNPLKQGKDSRRVFSLNKIFDTNVTQQEIYADTQPLVRSVLDGYNVCIFAYGQTGSGKTYTMSGPDLTTEDTWGVNYRALRDLFYISKARMNAVEYEVGVQMIEIYNEQVRDLLVSDGSNRRLDIRNNSQLNGLNVPDASLIPVKNTQDVLDLMKVGLRNRAVGATALNERSSRSHSILTVHVRGKELVSGNLLKGCLHLVDLAGSERVDKSEAVGERLKEAQHINRSLSALGDVIAALAQKSSHVPYRNSKLTQVLQDSLGGHAKTLMFVHINPEVNALGETISTLKFAQRVATIELGAAQSNKETCEIKEFRDEISKLKATLEQKEAELEQLKIRTNVRGAASPLRMQKHNNPILKPETTFQHMDTRDTEMRSRSSGKQRRSHLPSKFMDKDFIPKMPILVEERSVVDPIRPPSPPVKRSTSTDRAALMRPKTKPDVLENQQPLLKVPFPSSVPVNKSASLRSTIPTLPGVLNSFQRVTIRNVHPENEEEQFKQALNVRQGGIRKTKPESKIKNQHHVSTKVQKSGVGETMVSDTSKASEETQIIDLPDPDNDHGIFKFPATSTTGARRLQRNLSRNCQNVEPRESKQTVDRTLAGYQENKLSNAVLQEPGNSSLPEFRRSRSTPRGKIFI